MTVHWAPTVTVQRVIAPYNISADPLAEVTVNVPFVLHKSWGTSQGNVLITATAPLRDYTQDALDEGFAAAAKRARDEAAMVQKANPDYRDPARY